MFSAAARSIVVLTLVIVAICGGVGAATAAAKSSPVPAPLTRGHLSERAKAHRKSKAASRPKAAKRAQTPADGALPAEGIFASCTLSADLTPCEQDLQAVHAAGFTVAVQSVNGDLAAMSAYATYAQSIGVSIMWQINDPGFWGGAWAGSSAANDFPQFATSCGCTGSVQILDAMIQWLASQPATYGYYAADDELLTPSESAGLTQYVDEIKAVDPTHMIMVGSNASQGAQYYSTGATIGNEIYPQTTGSVMPVAKNEATWQSIAQSASQDQRAANRAGTQSAFILQAFSFGDNLTDGEAVGVCTPTTSLPQCAAELPYPSAAAQLQLRNEVLENADPKLILWFNFGESYSESDRWAGLQQAVDAPYPAVASAARARRPTRSRSRSRSRPSSSAAARRR